MPHEFKSDDHRRVLAHLPPHRTKADWKEVDEIEREAGKYPDDWKSPRSRALDDLVARVAKDPYSVGGEEEAPEEVEQILLDHEADGLVARDGDEWAMTKAGLEALRS